MDRPKKANPNFDGSGMRNQKVRLFTCSNCGAKFSTEDNMPPTMCPKCDNSKFY